jgi:hypothetical protein
VNDLALVNDVLVSCSSDKTLRLWNPNSPGQHHRQLAAQLVARWPSAAAGYGMAAPCGAAARTAFTYVC